MSRFHDLRVARVDREAEDAVAIAFEVPQDLKPAFRFRPGQYLTLATDIDGQEVRRSYSICSGPEEEHLRVGVRRVADGLFSSFVTEKLGAGDVILASPHPDHGAALAGKVLVLPGTMGSSGSSAVMLELLYAGHASAALILPETDAILVLGVVVAREMGYPTIPVLRAPAAPFETGTRARISPGGLIEVRTAQP